MKLSQLIKELQDNIFECNDPDVVVEYNSELYTIPFIGAFDGNIVLYTNTNTKLAEVKAP